MAVESYYFSHDYNSRNDRKMVALLRKHGVAGVGVYWPVVEMLYEEGGYLMLSECDRIAFELHVKTELVQSVVTNFELFRNDGTRFWSESALRRLDERKVKSEKARSSAQKRWNQDANALPTDSEGNAIKERKGKKGKESDETPTVFFGEQSDSYVIVKKKYLGEETVRINGAHGLADYMSAKKSVLTHPEWAEKFMRNRKGDYFNEFMHLKRTFAIFVEKQYA